MLKIEDALKKLEFYLKTNKTKEFPEKEKSKRIFGVEIKDWIEKNRKIEKNRILIDRFLESNNIELKNKVLPLKNKNIEYKLKNIKEKDMNMCKNKKLEELNNYTATKSGLISFREDEKGCIFATTKNFLKDKKIYYKNKKNEWFLEKEAIVEALFHELYLEPKNFKEMFNIRNENKNEDGRSDWEFTLKDNLQNSMFIMETKQSIKEIKKNDVEEAFNQALNYNSNTKYIAVLYGNMEILMDFPNNIDIYSKLTREERESEGLNTFKNYGIYLEVRRLENGKTINDFIHYSLPTLIQINSYKNKEENYDYEIVKNAIFFPTESSYPEGIKNIRDIITIEEESKEGASSVSNKQNLVLDIFDSIITHLEINDYNECILDDDIMLYHGGVKQFFYNSKEEFTIFIKINEEKRAFLSFDMALVDGQNSLDSLKIIIYLLNEFEYNYDSIMNNNEELDWSNGFKSKFKKKIEKILEKEKNSVKGVRYNNGNKDIINSLKRSIEKLKIQIAIKGIQEKNYKQVSEMIKNKNNNINQQQTDKDLTAYYDLIPLLHREIITNDKVKELKIWIEYPKSSILLNEDFKNTNTKITIGEIINSYNLYTYKKNKTLYAKGTISNQKPQKKSFENFFKDLINSNNTETQDEEIKKMRVKYINELKLEQSKDPYNMEYLNNINEKYNNLIQKEENKIKNKIFIKEETLKNIINSIKIITEVKKDILLNEKINIFSDFEKVGLNFKDKQRIEKIIIGYYLHNRITPKDQSLLITINKIINGWGLNNNTAKNLTTFFQELTIEMIDSGYNY